MVDVQDIIREQDELKSHSIEFVLWPRQWLRHKDNQDYQWYTYKLAIDNLSQIPNDSGIYTLIIQPAIFAHPACSYLMYVGQTISLNRRFKQYLTSEKRATGRPKIYRMLNRYTDNLWFCYTPIPSADLDSIEDRFVAAFVPPCNSDNRLPAELRHAKGAF